jgi:FKBP-type peptidyl-prolyl cis-trans isomerase
VSLFQLGSQLTIAIGLSLVTGACTSVQPTLKPAMTAPGPDFLLRNAAARGVVTTPSGLQYQIVRSGPKTGPNPATGDTVSFDYEGRLLTGEIFDSSYERRKPFIGSVDGFIPGLTEALRMMRPGDEWIVWIPPDLAYGERGSETIPPRSLLQFRLAVHSVTSLSDAPSSRNQDHD